jgi:flavin-binding protein dodecin
MRVPVVKVLELVGSSPHSFQEAVQNAVAEAARTVDNIQGVEVVNWTAQVQGEQLAEYRANVKVAFLVDNQKRKMKPGT